MGDGLHGKVADQEIVEICNCVSSSPDKTNRFGEFQRQIIVIIVEITE